MYARIKVANEEDARMVADILHFWEDEASYAIVKRGVALLEGWWFVDTFCSPNAVEIVLAWAARNEVKIFSIETGRGNMYYEANS